MRVERNSHHKLEALHAADRLAFRRLVFDAAYAHRQIDFLRSQKAAGREIVIDLNVAETAALGRFSSSVGKLPWGNPDRPWTPEDFGQRRNYDFCKRMAEFVVETGADAVLAPVHAADDAAWLSVDRSACERLRIELDQAGATDVAIDYLLIVGRGDLRDPAKRAAAVQGVADLPAQNLWLRISGFGATATGVGTRNIIEAAWALQEVGLPLVLDMAGGFPALSALAFGGVGGISHGTGQRESFDLADWRRPHIPGQGGGSARRAYVPQLDRYLNEQQLQAFFSARGTKARFACNDTNCCRNGIEDMIENGHAHFITQRSRQVHDISLIPAARRAEHFLLRHLDPALRSARQASKLKFADDRVQKLVFEAKSRLNRLRDAMGALHEADAGAAPFCQAPPFRGGRDTGQVAVWRGRRR